MEILAQALTVVASIVIFIQDVTKRLIHLFWIFAFSFGVAIASLKYLSYGSIYFDVLKLNLVFLLLLFLILKLYFSFRNKAWTKIVNVYVGIADILLILPMAFCYNLHNYILLLILSCIIAIAYWIISNSIMKVNVTRIPFGGILVLVHCTVMVMSGIWMSNVLTYEI